MRVEMQAVLLAQMTINELLREKYLYENFPAKLFYWLNKLARKLGKAIKEFEGKRKELKDGPDFERQAEALLLEEVVVDFEPLSFELFEGLAITGENWLALLPFIEKTVEVNG